LALIVRKAECDAEAIIAHMRGFADAGSICRLAVPERVEFVASLARTSVGKLDKKAMRKIFL
jgi:fatty-acyl-CoA synthase